MKRGLDERGVSPVVGVMLMLVVTIIIAAVVSGFAGGMMGSNQKAPSLSMDIKISNTGSWVGSGFTATVLGVSEPISTNDLKIITSWSTKKDGKTVVGGSTVTPGVTKRIAGDGLNVGLGAPFGFGNGIDGTSNVTYPYTVDQDFGNFTLIQGTGLLAIPAGAKEGDDDAVGGLVTQNSGSGYGIPNEFNYTSGEDKRMDAAEYVLGEGWEALRSGDKVQVNFVYMPTGKVILSKEVGVTEG
ncbi:flagellin-like protein [Methanomicrobium sp. W14]|uniref:type IV pilin N-terminal domain-containing protein n=1 Tax=Methanomicrobium sp. W14 TaxID=2817839 RepID=UPI001FD8B697|nr:type IV pilin N-terminal domain-containing protein [Methanomicrobium sp. W14]MBP2134403.1 flagellin-like protein [Methanomicrobium sp. W14]